LISLRFVDRTSLSANMVVIRRELPRTRKRGSGPKPCRIGVSRILLTEGLLERCLVGTIRRRGLALGRRALGGDPDRPNEAEHLATDRRDHFVLLLPGRHEAPIALVQSLLRLPSDCDDLLGRVLLGVFAAGR
jgi:hypothetical protein